ncbi:MAG: hypothetical protein BGO65_12260 [Afipia sp. 64-13]|nr:MAG: hypothetical protein BGO65_12260 [Afipia sp. 64-13]
MSTRAHTWLGTRVLIWLGILRRGRGGAHRWAPPIVAAIVTIRHRGAMAGTQATIGIVVVPIEQDPIEIGRMRANAVFGALALFLLDPAGIDQPFKGPLHRCARATDFLRHPDLAADAPALIVDVAAEQAQHLQIARFEGGIRDGAGRDDR